MAEEHTDPPPVADRPTRPRPPVRGPQPNVDSTAEVDIRDFFFPPAEDSPADDGKPKKR